MNAHSAQLFPIIKNIGTNECKDQLSANEIIFSSIIHKHEILDTIERERESKDQLSVTTWGNHL
jgi:hypothetical protein